MFGITVIAFSCLGQEMDGDLDSLLTDGVHGPKSTSASRPSDTATHRNDSLKSAAVDTVRSQPNMNSSVADTASRQQEMPASGTIDTTSRQEEIGSPVSIEPQPPSFTKELPAAPDIHALAPFSSNTVHYVGVSLDYFSYAEVTSIADVFPGYPVGYPANWIEGSPKSTEYGLLFGINYESAIRKPGTRLLFRPRLEGQIGINQTYDGSTQAQPISKPGGDTIGWKFWPVKFSKSNYFAHAGLDIGYCRTRAIYPFYLYSGIRGNVWYRDMVPDTVSYKNQITVSELYYWFSLPLGLAVSIPRSPVTALGFDASVDVLFFGQMQAYNSAYDPVNTSSTKSPAVTLGDRIGYRLEFSIIHKTATGNTFRIAPYFNLYTFGQSETEISKDYVNDVYTPGSDQSFNEPSSLSWLLGLKVQIAFLSPYSRTY